MTAKARYWSVVYFDGPDSHPLCEFLWEGSQEAILKVALEWRPPGEIWIRVEELPFLKYLTA